MDEEADLALLDQHLIKTNQLSQRMTGILSQLDARLSKLDKTIAPLGMQPHYRHGHRLLLSHLQPDGESTTPIQPPDTGTPADESVLILKGASLSALAEYFGAIDSIRFDLEKMDRAGSRAREAGIKDLSSLVNTGLESATQLFLQTLENDSSKPLPLEQIILDPPMPERALRSYPELATIISYFNSLADSSSMTVRNLSQQHLTDITKGYTTARSLWCRTCLARSAEAIEDMDAGAGLGGEAEIDMRSRKVNAVIQISEALLSMAESETLLIRSLWQSPVTSILPDILRRTTSLIDDTLGTIISIIKKSVSDHAFLAMELYEALAAVQGRWDGCWSTCLERAGGASVDDTAVRNIFATHLGTLRSIALRSFPELLVDIKTSPLSGGSSSGIADITHSTIRYLERLPRHETLISKLLQSLGERNWLMGASEPPSSAKSASEGGILNLFVADVIGTLMKHLTARCQSMKRLIGSVFLLNNISHVRETISSFPSDIVGPGAEDMLNKSFREAKSAYLSEWKALIALLTTQGSNNTRFGVGRDSERQQMKESITAFFERLEELEKTSRQYPLSRQEAELRDRLRMDTIGVILPAYSAYHAKCNGKSLEKYLRMSPFEIERRVEALFS